METEGSGLNLVCGYLFCLNDRVRASNSCPSALRCCGPVRCACATRIVIRKGAPMAIDKKEDQSVLNHIDSFVKYQERLYAPSALPDHHPPPLSALKAH